MLNSRLRAIQKGKPEYTTYSLNGTEHKAVRIDKHLYIPEKAKQSEHTNNLACSPLLKY